jgi:hypothetical protein
MVTIPAPINTDSTADRSTATTESNSELVDMMLDLFI